jgi:hypothetical protein
VLAIAAGITMGGQNYFFASGAATLTTRLRKMCFRAVLQQDGTFSSLFLISLAHMLIICGCLVEFFDNEKNTVGFSFC